MNTVVPGSTVTLSLSLEAVGTPANNPVTGATTEVSIRRLSDDKWWDFTANAGDGEWDTVAFGSLGPEHKQALTDKGDGSYEYDWDQASADASATRTYLMYYKVTVDAGTPTFANQVKHEIWDFTSGATGTNTVNFTVVDGVATPIQGATIAIRASAGGANLRPGITTETDGTATTSLNAATYYVQVTLNGYTHTEEAVVVDEDPEAVALTMTAVVITGADSPGTIRIYAYPYELDGDVEDDTTALFKVAISTPAQTSDGVLVESEKSATQHAGGYWYVDVPSLDDLTAMDSPRTLTYHWTFRNGHKFDKDVNDTDADPSNLISDLD